MAQIRLVPSSYGVSNTALSVTNPSNMYTNTDSTNYATVTNTKTGTSSYYIYIGGFNFEDIPEGATINSFTVKFKANESGGSTSTSYRPYLWNGSATMTGSCSVINTTVQTLTFTDVTATFDEIKALDNSFGLRINCRRNSRSTTAYFYIYGAEILVDYTESVKHTVNISCTNGTTIPSGSEEVIEGESLEIKAFNNDGYTFSSITVNGSSVTPTEKEETLLENGVCLYHLDNSAEDALNNTTMSTTGTFSTTTKFGSHSMALTSGQYATITLPSTYTQCTVECWFYITQANTSGKYPTLFSTETTNSSGGTYLHIDDGAYSVTTVCRSNAAGGSSNNGGYGETTVTRNTWHHFAYCRNNSNHYFFIDGNLEYTVTQSNPDSWSTIYLGGLKKSSTMDSNCYMPGYIDEVLVSDVCKWKDDFVPPTSPYDASIKKFWEYTIPSITTDMNVIVIFSEDAGAILYVKEGGSWKQYSAVYKKINGSWVLQTDLASAFSTSANYVKG